MRARASARSAKRGCRISATSRPQPEGASVSYETITFDVRDNGIATMTLNRPKSLNCFTQSMFKEWSDVISKCAYDKKIKVLVITGNGRAFSSGVDLSVLGSDTLDPAQFKLCRVERVTAEHGKV